MENFSEDAVDDFMFYIVMHESFLMCVDWEKYQSHSRMKLSKTEHADLDGIPHYDMSAG